MIPSKPHNNSPDTLNVVPATTLPDIEKSFYDSLHSPMAKGLQQSHKSNLEPKVTPSASNDIPGENSHFNFFSSENLTHGTVNITERTTIKSKKYKNISYTTYNGYYNPHKPLSIINTKFNDFLPSQVDIFKDRVDYYDNLLQAPPFTSIEPIEISPTENGKFMLTDGHHRLVAGLQNGHPIPFKLYTDTEPAPATSWKNVSLIE